MACNPSPCWKLQKPVSGARTRTRNHTRNRALDRRRADVHMLRRLKIQGHLPKLHQTAGQSQGHCFTHDGLQQICTGAGYKEMPALQTKWMHSPANQLKAGSCPATGFAAHERVTLSCKDPTHARSIIRGIERPAGIQRPYHLKILQVPASISKSYSRISLGEAGSNGCNSSCGHTTSRWENVGSYDSYAS